MAGGKTVAQVGGKMLSYWVKQPFLSESGRQSAKDHLNRQSADILFKAMSLLKGTALKIAQQLSLETNVFPDAIRKELEKSYHQVPPINRALARKAIHMGLGDFQENLFQTFDDRAFAAASLGQVHRAVSRSGQSLAVKIQYPGIAATIESDISLVRSILWPLADYNLLKPAIDEIEARLMEEIDYRKEAENIRFFKSRLDLAAIHIPDVHEATSHETVISTNFFKGIPLDLWLKKSPSQERRNRVAQSLQDLFIQSLYELNCIHADPNPGNFLIADDLTVGLVDFGCVKHLHCSFTDLYAQMPKVMVCGEKKNYFELLDAFHIISPKASPEIREALFEALMDFRPVFGRLFTEEYFDFRQHPDFISQMKPIRDRIYRLRHHIDMNPDFVFLDRTRYGLFRLFEKMQARLSFQNKWEWPA